MLSSVPTIPHAHKAWVLGEFGLLSQQEVHNLHVNTNIPLMLIITNFLMHLLHRCILLIQRSRVSEGYRCKPVAVVQKNTFQRSIAAVTEQSPNFWLVLWHSTLVQKLYNIHTVHHQVLLFLENKILFMPIGVECNASTVKEGVIFLQSGCQQFSREL